MINVDKYTDFMIISTKMQILCLTLKTSNIVNLNISFITYLIIKKKQIVYSSQLFLSCLMEFYAVEAEDSSPVVYSVAL